MSSSDDELDLTNKNLQNEGEELIHDLMEKYDELFLDQDKNISFNSDQDNNISSNTSNKFGAFGKCMEEYSHDTPLINCYKENMLIIVKLEHVKDCLINTIVTVSDDDDERLKLRAKLIVLSFKALFTKYGSRLNAKEILNVNTFISDIYRSVYYKYKSSLPPDHVNNWDVEEKNKSFSQRMGYKGCVKMARALVIGVSWI